MAEAELDELRVSLDAVTPKVSLWFVGMQANLHQMPDFVRLGSQIGVPEVVLQRLVYFGDGQSVGEGTPMVPDQTLFAALEQQQMDLIAESELLAARLGMIFHASGAATHRESIVSERGASLTSLPAPLGFDVYHRNRDGFSMLHRPFCSGRFSLNHPRKIFTKTAGRGVEGRELPGITPAGVQRSARTLALPVLRC